MIEESTLNLKALKVNQNIASRNYWKNRFSDFEFRTYFEHIQLTQRPLDHKRPGACQSKASAGLYQDLCEIAPSDNARHLILLSALGIFISKYASTDDVCVFSLPYTNDAKREHNLMPVRMNGFAGTDFRTFLSQLKQNMLQDLKHRHYPVEKIFSLEVLEHASPVGMLLEGKHPSQAFDVLQPGMLFCFKIQDALALTLRYDQNTHDEKYVSLLPGLYFSLLGNLVRDVKKSIEAVELISEQERSRIINEFNDTDSKYDRSESVIEMFESRVEKNPFSTALESGGQAISFHNLNIEVNKLSHYLYQAGVRPNEPVAILLRRSVDFVVSVLAVLKVGGVYLPIDPDYPGERINYLLKDSHAGFLITHDELLAATTIQTSVVKIALDTNRKEIQACPILNPGRKNGGSIYVIYTSGSTGKPKGVIGTQVGLLNRLRWGWHKYPYTAGEVCSQKTSLSFVDHVAEMFSPLLMGVPLAVIDAEDVMDVNKLVHCITGRKISRITLVPSLLQALIQVVREKKIEITTLQYVFCSGENLPLPLAREFFEVFPSVKLVNIYGSTEVSADVTAYTVNDMFHAEEQTSLYVENRKVPIGTPMFNTRILILDRNDRLMPIGVPGEICVSGDAVAPGYLNGQELTASRMTDNPFFRKQKMYRTGDLGRWLPDGNIEYLGRLDHEVKIRGFRIRLGEIEDALRTLTAIHKVAVVARGMEGDQQLVAYYVSETDLRSSDLRLYLSGKLPGYMVPSHYIRLQQLPLTPSGKTDRHALPEPEIRAGEDYQAPSDETEKKLVSIWADVLRLEAPVISVTASFFELGGHSLRAMSLVNKIQEVFGITISIREVFDRKDIRSLGRLLRTSERSVISRLKRAESREYYELSIAQQRVYYFYELDKLSLAFNLPAVTRIEGPLDMEKLRSVFMQLVNRHETLHASFRIVNDKPAQFIHKDFTLPIEEFQCTEDGLDSIIHQFIRPFDLSQAPLFRVGLVQTAQQVHYLMVDMHHIISDGASIGLLINDFMLLYNDVPLLPLELDYKDYAMWQQSAGYQNKIARQKDFWVKQFSEAIVPLDLPIDFARPTTTEGGTFAFALSADETRQLRAIAEKEVATISMIILSVLNILLGKMANQEDVVVGMAVAGREQFELEGMIGMFPVVLPLRTYPKAELSFREFLTSLKATFLSSFDNQSYQYEELAKELNLERTTARNPWFDVMYLYQNFERSSLAIPGVVVTPYKEQNTVAYEKLNLTVIENRDQLCFRLVYATALFKKETMERLAKYFRHIVNVVIRDTGVRIADIEMTEGDNRAYVAHAGNNRKSIARDKGFSALFRDQVSRTPLNIAVRHNDSALTYEALSRESVHLASRLKARGVAPDRNVALLLPRGIGMLTSILAVFHAGGAYVPVDVDFPLQRIQEILSGCRPQVVIVSAETLHLIDGIKGIHEMMEVICIDPPDEANKKLIEPVQQQGDDLAYIIYTSGTTGKPKGVMIHQLGMINHLHAMIDILKVDEKDVIAQTASPCFDISVWQFLTALVTGATTCIIDKEKIMEPAVLVETLQREGVTIFQAVPSLLATFLDEVPEGSRKLEKLRWMIPTGESLTAPLAKKWYSYYPHIPLLNAYGPAEASDDVTTYVVAPPEEGQLAVPIGTPIQNMQVYIVNDSMKICPVGVKGEICVAGIGVGKGYWRDEEKTRSAFVSNPFVQTENDPDYATLYKTGDIGYYLPDGSIMCCGRRDDQVKIRGYRIELNEVEGQLLQHDMIQEVTVQAKESDGIRYLVAYYAAPEEIAPADIEKFLADRLPQYMIPSYYVRLAKLPLTPNGKLDRRALPEPDIKTEMQYVAPANEMEERLAVVWSSVLKLDADRIGVESSFFTMGGHSLSAIILLNRVYKEFQVKVLLKEFFMKPTIRFTAEYIETHRWLQAAPSVEAVDATEVII
ncbi:amino acid adenylation domain-containing protein [Fulvivirgaceae bacterium PWU4]|uniref:Amino acid adenylation domain-containing protein n=1 Tax=Chryseosolibacter histidini TaxID=2782349 RepID=A0AAP2DFZ0_9BACT|nr:non-ribosomal peptide synthetase [Chryseosolibacter histidini]MBT1695441.1 amino acid adenylation domain-containing protein [Chryseosolibacter histidini]